MKQTYVRVAYNRRDSRRRSATGDSRAKGCPWNESWDSNKGKVARPTYRSDLQDTPAELSDVRGAEREQGIRFFEADYDCLVISANVGEVRIT